MAPHPPGCLSSLGQLAICRLHPDLLTFPTGSVSQDATTPQSPKFTDVLSGPSRNVPFLHDPGEVGSEPLYAERTATRRYRTTPLRVLWQSVGGSVRSK